MKLLIIINTFVRAINIITFSFESCNSSFLNLLFRYSHGDF